MEVAIVKGEEKEKTLVLKMRRGDDLIFNEIDFSNYFFISKDDFLNGDRYNFENFFYSYELYNNSHYKLFLKNNFKRNQAKQMLEDRGIEVYEGDISSFKRFIIDNQDIKLNHKNLKRVWLDIETCDISKLSRDMKGIVEANSPIMSCAIKEDDTKKIVFFENKARQFMNPEKLKELKTKLDNNEKINSQEYIEFIELMSKCEAQLLQEIFNYLRNKDLVLAWNGKGFDFPYLQQRMKLNEIKYDDIMINDMDYMELYKANFSNQNVSVDNYKLETVSYEELKEELESHNPKFQNIEEIKKVDWREKTNAKKFFDLYLFYPEVFREYNIQDVNLMDLIETKLRLLDLKVVQSDISRCPISNTVFDSYISDYLLINEYKKLGYVVPSRPNKDVIEQRSDPFMGEFPPGGYTYVRKTGLYFGLYGFDFKSQYPTVMITFNISPETYLKKINPLDLDEIHNVLLQDEIDYLKFAIEEKKNHMNAKGELKKSYYKTVDNKKLEDIMWKFTNNYKMQTMSELAKKEQFVFTPADINNDTRGWNIHPHFCFKRQEGVVARIEKMLLVERDKVKYEIKNIKDENQKRSMNDYQLGLKVSANSLYGGFGFKSFRFYKYEIAAAITTSSRYLTKRSVLFAESLGFITSHGDTDSAFISQSSNKLTIEELEKKYFDFFNDYIKPFNTSCEIELFNPNTNQKQKCNHFIVFENEKYYESCIVVAKKRYYYKQVDGDKIKYGTQGGAFKRKDILSVAKNTQKELTQDILDAKFNKEIWLNKILAIRNKVFSFQLEDNEVIKSSTLTKPVEEFGKPVIDGKTGKQKVRKSDGAPMFAAIPAHIVVAKKLLLEGQQLEVDDKIKYVVVEYNPIKGISLNEYYDNKRYDAEYYWSGIESVLVEILKKINYELCYTYFRPCWSLSDKQIKKLLVDKIDDIEEDGEDDEGSE